MLAIFFKVKSSGSLDFFIHEEVLEMLNAACWHLQWSSPHMDFVLGQQQLIWRSMPAVVFPHLFFG
jgi:hypothetical protein